MHPRHIYIHVPFCARRCSYCDFSIAVRKETPVAEYLDSLKLELERTVGEWEVDTVYFGGGTPSRLGGEGIGDLMNMLRSRVFLTPSAEVTLEANPEDITEETASKWRSAGVNRLSIGVQSFNDNILEWMHRTHSSAKISRAVDNARKAGLDNISIDLIFSLPQSLNRDWKADLESALSLNPSHISLYGLTIEPKTPLARWEERGTVVQAPDTNYEQEYLLAHNILTSAGYEHYEVSNFGKPGKHSKHNSAYWTGVPYIGLGPSAHSFDGVQRSWNVSPYAEWVQHLGHSTSPKDSEELLGEESREIERLYLGLRTTKGATITPQQLEMVKPWITAGWATTQDNLLHLTPQGWLRLDALVGELMGA